MQPVFTQQAQNIAREDMLKVEQPAKHSPFGISNETWKSQSRWSINLVGALKADTVS
jgi:hypothetical protein